MAKVKKILACIDLSENSGKVLEYALELLEGRVDAEIILYSVIPQKNVDHVVEVGKFFAGYENLGGTAKEYVAKITADRTEQINVLIRDVGPGENVKLSVRIEVGYPYESILETVKKEQCDLVVLGKKGKDHIVPVTLGSIALRVLRHSPVPVLVIPNGKI